MNDEPDWNRLAQPPAAADFEGETIHDRYLDAKERADRALDGIIAELRKLARLVDRDW